MTFLEEQIEIVAPQCEEYLLERAQVLRELDIANQYEHEQSSGVGKIIARLLGKHNMFGYRDPATSLLETDVELLEATKTPLQRVAEFGDDFFLVQNLSHQLHDSSSGRVERCTSAIAVEDMREDVESFLHGRGVAVEQPSSVYVQFVLSTRAFGDYGMVDLSDGLERIPESQRKYMGLGVRFFDAPIPARNLRIIDDRNALLTLRYKNIFGTEGIVAEEEVEDIELIFIQELAKEVQIHQQALIEKQKAIYFTTTA